MAEIISNGNGHPTIRSAPSSEAPPDVSKLANEITQLTVAAIGPVVNAPDPLSRGAVVQVSTVAASDTDPLGGHTSRYLQTLLREAPSGLFTNQGRPVDTTAFQTAAARDPHQYRLMLALPDAHRVDMHAFTRDVMARVERDLGRPLDWLAVAHTQHRLPHVHVILQGRGCLYPWISDSV